MAALTKAKASSPAAMSWVSLPDKAYLVQYSPSLLTGSWTTIATIHGIGTLTTFTDTDPIRLIQPQGFYRVSLVPWQIPTNP
ncbi:MAG: hypothetical protein NTW21_04810 [Verrucomicrobia bacterium]|nr:hypothetical protein [Verrucomicrobiota bacterium]